MVSGGKLVSLPGCPMNVVNLTATIVHYLAAGNLPPADMAGRPLFAYGHLVHNQCERRPHFEFGEFALSWGDEGAQKGWCLYKLGCKGPETMANCPTVRYGGEVSWNVRAGAGCVGCTTPHFWDSMLPAYTRLGTPVSYLPELPVLADLPILPNMTVDQMGIVLLAGIGGVAALHGTGMTVREHRKGVAARHEKEAAAKRHATAEARRVEQAEQAETSGSAELPGSAETPELPETPGSPETEEASAAGIVLDSEEAPRTAEESRGGEPVTSPERSEAADSGARSGGPADSRTVTATEAEQPEPESTDPPEAS
jgi:hydrogenase small subunit